MKSLTSFAEQESLSQQEMKEIVGGTKKAPVVRPKKRNKGILIDQGGLLPPTDGNGGILIDQGGLLPNGTWG